MKNQSLKITGLLLILSLFVVFTACKKSSDEKESYTCKTCSSTPTAKTENNNSNKGVYKGTVVGSSGIISFDLANTGSSATATLSIDGDVVQLTSDNVPQNGQAYTSTFTGTYNGQAVSLTFSVGATGSAPTITASNIPGHLGAVFQLFKETSDNLITCYEGTFSGKDSDGKAESGNLNLVVSTKSNTWFALIKNSSNSSASVMSGKVSENVFTCACGSSANVTGTLTGDQINGTYQTDGHGTWVAKRTL